MTHLYRVRYQWLPGLAWGLVAGLTATEATHLASALARVGYRTVAIETDTDPPRTVLRRLPR